VDYSNFSKFNPDLNLCGNNLVKMYDNDIERLFTIKTNFYSSCSEIEKKLKSSSLSNSEIKSLKKKLKKYKSKAVNIEKEIENLVCKQNSNLINEKESKLQKEENKIFIAYKEKQYTKISKIKTNRDHSCFGEFDRNNRKCKYCILKVRKKCAKRMNNIKNKNHLLDYGPVNRVELTLLLIGVFILSFSVLIFEISLTRIFSVMLTYHYTFFVVSMAILGLGFGGIILHFAWNKLPLERKGFNFLTIITLALSISVPLLLLLILHFSYVNNIIFYIFIMIIPFILAGIIFAFIFKQFTHHSSFVYGVDLIGAGIGCIIVILLFMALGGINSILLLGSIISLGGLTFAIASKKDTNVVISLVVILILSLGFIQNYDNDYLNDIPLSNSPNKELSSVIETYGDDVNIIETRWSISGRTDLVSIENDPDVMYIFIDAAAPTQMYRFNGNIFDKKNTAIQSLSQMYGTYFGFLFGEKDDVLIIGAGGGQDVLVALMGGAKNITAVDVNQATVDIMKDYSWFNGGLYTDFPNVNVVVDEGRSFIRNTNNKYDIILLSIPVTKTSGSASGYSMAENYLFTTDSFEDYFDPLSENGRIIIIPHHLPEVYKLTATVLTFFNNIGFSTEQAMQHIIIAGSQSYHDMQGTMFPAFIIRKTPYSPQEGKERHDIAMEIGYSHLYTPPKKLCNMVDDNLYNLASGVNTLDDFIKNSNVNIIPATDNRPFFYNSNKGLPESLKSLSFLTFMIVIGAILIPFIKKSSEYSIRTNNINSLNSKSKKKRGRNKKNKLKNKYKSNDYIDLNITKIILFFSLLGIGFMLIEVSLIQKFILFLGKPMLSLSITLFSLLISSGIGSIYSNKLKNNILNKIVIISVIIGIIIIIYTVTLPYIFNLYLGNTIIERSIISGIILIPLGFFLGLMFPLGMTILEQAKEDDKISWMWGINGATSVFGSVLAISIAVLLGFSYALITGALAYFLIAIAFK